MSNWPSRITDYLLQENRKNLSSVFSAGSTSSGLTNFPMTGSDAPLSVPALQHRRRFHEPGRRGVCDHRNAQGGKNEHDIG